MASALEEYAEALRTGRNLRRARELRPYIARKHPVTLAALDEVMPHRCPGASKRARKRKPPPQPPPTPLDVARRNAGMGSKRRDLGSSIEASVKRRVRDT